MKLKTNLFLLLPIVVSLALTSTGCARKSIVYESIKTENQTKQFLPPSEGMAGLYYVATGTAHEYNDFFIDGLNIASLTDCTYIYTELPLGTHNIATNTDFKDVDFTENKNYYFYTYYGFIDSGALSSLLLNPETTVGVYALKGATTCKVAYDKEVKAGVIQVVKDEQIPLIKKDILKFKQVVSK